MSLISTAADIIILKIWDVFLIWFRVSLVLRFYNADIADWLLRLCWGTGMRWRILCAILDVLHQTVPCIDQFTNTLLIPVNISQSISPLLLLWCESEDDLFEFSHLDCFFLDDCPQEIDETTLQKLLLAAYPSWRRSSLALHDAYDILNVLQTANKGESFEESDAGLESNGLIIGEIEEGPE